MNASSEDPLTLFQSWFTEAKAKEPGLPEAMALASATPEGTPSLRMVLLKGADAAGFVFYTNFESRKGHELKLNAKAALLFHWKSLARQIRVEGAVEEVSAAEADAYFASRPKDAQIGAWASQQSRPMAGRFDLEKRVAVEAARFALGKVPRPPYWSGFRIVPTAYEFWRERPFRLHERIRFERDASNVSGGAWRSDYLFP